MINKRSIWLVIIVLVLQIALPTTLLTKVNANTQQSMNETMGSLDISEEIVEDDYDKENSSEVNYDDAIQEEAEPSNPVTEDEEVIRETDQSEEVETEVTETNQSEEKEIIGEAIPEEDDKSKPSMVQSKWQVDGKLIYAYENGEAEYEFAFRHVPVEEAEYIDLEEATFYFDLPPNAVYRSSTFWGVYEPENHRVVWQNIGGILTSHANFDPATPRRVNVQIDYLDQPTEATVMLKATYTPKGGEQKWTNEAVISHTFEKDEVEWEEGIHISGALEKRPGIPQGYPLLTGQHFTYDIYYSLNSLQPYKYGQLFVQLPGTIQFNKHVQLTGDFKDYYYDAEQHRFVFNFKDEILKARGTMKINNLVFPNYVTPDGTRSELNMQFVYNDTHVHGIEPDILVAMAKSDWKVSHQLPEKSIQANEPFDYTLIVNNENTEEFGQLQHSNMTLTEYLPEEATYVASSYETNGVKKSGTYDATRHAVMFLLDDDVSLKEHEISITLNYKKVPERRVRHNIELVYVPLQQESKVVQHSFRYKVQPNEVKPPINGGGSTGGNSSTGENGSTGGNSSTGENGSTGENSSTGENGSTGENSSTGENGSTGGNSSTGENGSTGGNSSTGENGSTGGNSSTGENGSTGENSSTGENGSTGENSSTGENGSTGGNSSTGENGSTGENSSTGENGSTGGNSSTGENSSMSETGSIGETGSKEESSSKDGEYTTGSHNTSILPTLPQTGEQSIYFIFMLGIISVIIGYILIRPTKMRKL